MTLQHMMVKEKERLMKKNAISQLFEIGDFDLIHFKRKTRYEPYVFLS